VEDRASAPPKQPVSEQQPCGAQRSPHAASTTTPDASVWILPASSRSKRAGAQHWICIVALDQTTAHDPVSGQQCTTEAYFAATGVATVGSGGATGTRTLAPHETFLAGVVPDSVTLVTLGTLDRRRRADIVSSNF
jgi:hypothetical protein